MFTKRHLAVIGGVILLSLSSPSFGIVITDLQYWLDGGDFMNDPYCFTGTASGGDWMIYEVSDFVEPGALQPEGGDFSVYTIQNATISWSSAPRTAEQSGGVTAKGWFSYAGGVTLSISGDLCQSGSAVYTGSILEAQIVDDLSEQLGDPDGSSFCVYELAALTDNILHAQVEFQITGGELYAGKVGKETTLTMDDFTLEMELKACNTGFPPMPTSSVNDFSHDMLYYGIYPTHFLMTAVPEPCTVVLLAAGGFFLIRRRVC